MSPVSASQGGTARAWGWVAHLREGGTTPWHAWTGEGVPTARVLPGAQQLELLRRVNCAAGKLSAGPHGVYNDFSTRLADRVLTAAAPGRGKPDLPLVGVSDAAYGPRPVDPSLLPADELIRVATSVLAEDVVALGLPVRPRQLRRVWHRGYRLAGDPLETAHVRDHLTRRGRPPGGSGATVLILGGPLDQMLADVWTRRCFERGSGSWLPWLRFWQQRGELPPRIDLPAVAERHLARHQHVKVVLDPSQLRGILGVRSLPPSRRPGADAAELARRIATVVGLLFPAQERAALMTHTLLPRMPATTAPPVALPDEHREWVSAAAKRMARELSRAGYPVLGDAALGEPAAPATPVIGVDTGTGMASVELVLKLAVRMLVDEDWKRGSR